MKVTSDIFYIGVNDRDIDLFEGQYPVKNGMAYNSYAIKDDKTAVIDTVDARFTNEWLENVKSVFGDACPDYLIIQHMEPDHSANIANFMSVYPATTIVATAKAFSMMQAYFGTDFSDNRVVIAEGDTLELGRHTLTFVHAPMVHWPEVMLSYDLTDKILFSADAFGKFGAFDTEEAWEDEARRYFIGIVGKFGAQVQALLKKAANLEIKTICPLHGPILTENLGHYIALYDKWSSYAPEEDGVVIAYTSIYGNTRKAVEDLTARLKEKGKTVVLYDLARSDMYSAVADAFRYTNLVLATTTYNADIFPYMRTFISHLVHRNFQNRTVSLIENGSWAPQAAKTMRGMLENCKNLNFTETTVSVKAALDSTSIAQLSALADEL